MKTLKKLVSVLLVVVMLMTSAPLSGFVGLEISNPFSGLFAHAEEETATEAEGVTWSFNEETGELRISGEGEMEQCYIDNIAPWNSYKELIKTAIIEQGITSIGDFAFEECTSLESITINNPDCTIADDELTIPSGAVIYGHADSTAAEYASKYERTFIAFGCSHENTVEYAEIPATCEEDGYTAGTYCEDCQTWIAGGVTIPAGHILADEPTEVPATCMQDGYSIRFCTVCGLPDGKWVTVDEQDYPVFSEEAEVTGTLDYSFFELPVRGKVQTYLFYAEDAYKLSFNLSCTSSGGGVLGVIAPTVTIIDSYGNIVFKGNSASMNELIEIEGDSFTLAYEFYESYEFFGSTVTLTNTFSFGDLKAYCVDDSKVKTEDATGHSYINIPKSFPQQCDSYDPESKSVCVYCGLETPEPGEVGKKNKYSFEFNVTARTGAYTVNDIRIIYCDNNGELKYTTIPDVDEYFSAVGTKNYDFELDGTLIGYYHNRSIGLFSKLDYNVVFYATDGNGNYRRIDRVTLSGSGTYSTQTSHVWDEGTVTTEATCTTEGTKHCVCACGGESDFSISSLGHDYGSWTNLENGTHSRVCSRDASHTESEICYDAEPVVYEATCTLDGYTVNTCDICSYGWTNNIVEATGHTVGEDVSIVDSTCSVLGKKTYTCDSCGEFIEESLPLAAHNYESTIVDPTCTESGYTSYTCTACGDIYKDSYIDANGHSYGEWVEITASTCSTTGLKERICSICSNVDSETIPALEHSYESVTTAPTCSTIGYTTYTCKVCGNGYTGDYISALGHTNTLWTETKAPTCTGKGVESSVCDTCGKTSTRYTDALGHSFGEWYTEKEPTVLEEGVSVRICEVCDKREEKSIDRLIIDFEENDDYGLVNFTVVDAQTLAPVEGASIFVTTEAAGEDTFFTDKDGKVSAVLPVGEAKVSAYIDGCQVRNFKFEIKAGINDIPQIGLSSGNIYEADLTVKEMTYQEILDAGIDTSAEGNTHIEKYELTFQFDPQKDSVSINAYYNEDGKCVDIDTGSNNGGSDDEKEKNKYILHYHVEDKHKYCKYVTVKKGETVKLDYLPDVSYDDYEFNGWYSDKALSKKITSVTVNKDKTVYGRLKSLNYDEPEPDPEPDPEPTPSVTAGDYTVYPVSEDMYLIIKGEISWLKEMFDVRLLVFNRSMTDTLSSLKAEIVLPNGLSLAEMSSYAQSLAYDMSDIKGGEYGCAQWYVRGDEAGTYDVRANLTGEILPFGEKINDTFSIDSAISVIAENALQMNIEIPDTVYYGKDFPAKITLTNVSGKTIHKVSHILTGIEQTGIAHYSNGEKKSTCFMNEAGTVAKDFATVFEPGDQLVFDLNITAKYVSELMKHYIEEKLKQIDMFEGVYKTSKTVVAVAELFGSIKGLASSATSFTLASLNGKNIPAAKMDLASDIIDTISEITGLVDAQVDCIGDSVVGSYLLSAGSLISPVLKTFGDPERALEWVFTSSVSDMSSVLSDLRGYVNACERAKEVRTFNVFDAMRAAISAIPVAFVLDDVIFKSSGTVSIPKSYTTTKSKEQYFGVDDLNKYINDIADVVSIKTYNDFVPDVFHVLSKIDVEGDQSLDDIYVEKVEYIIATQEEINKVKITNQENAENGGVEVKSWIETTGISTYSLRSTSASAEDLFELSCSDNETAVYEDGVLTFSGSGTLDIVPKGNVNGVLHIEREDGTKVEVDLIVVEEHECEKARHIIIAPTETEPGYAADYCTICEEVLEVVELDAAVCNGNHTFGEWTMITESDCEASGLKARSCSSCGYTEIDFADAFGHTEKTVNAVDATCTGMGYTGDIVCEICGETVSEGEAIDSLGHNLGAYVQITPPTCTSEGEEKASCTRCDYSETKEISATGHSYSSVVTAPTCTEKGYTTYTCECGDSYKADYTDMIDHEYTSEVTKEATHLEKGETTFTCACGDTYTEPIAVIPHSYKSVITAPTCTERGYTTYTCECGDSYVDDYVGTKAHSYSGAVTRPATHLAEGIKTYTCTSCDDSYIETIAKIKEHSYVISNIVAPTCEQEGYTVYICECGHSYKGDKVSATGHNYEGDTCKTCGESKTQNCSCNCHKSGFMGFIWKILRFFYKLFKIQPVCDCGVAHY